MQAIQNALDALPEERTTPCNVYLQGTFYPVSNIIMKDNVNLIGNNATLISVSQWPIFIHDSGKAYNEPYGQPFKIDGELYQDWITLHNVTFQSIHFKQLIAYSHPDNCAIYFYDGNSSGWGLSDNLSVYNCQFEGFYNCIQGLAINSNYIGNIFQDYLNNAIMFPAGSNLTIENNIFNTPSNDFTVEQYQERDGSASIQGGIGLFLMDVSEVVSIRNNTFVEGANSTGITFSSSNGNFIITGNVFSGEGSAISFDVFPRPWLSSGIKFFGNSGADDFCYDYGVFSEFGA
ncbi:MAG: hypothetical protein NWE98_02895 [Candidatus Bathyarchaeota archaeon]|nr:hypothetical protein [Candidatus Bathyarchaeota archaeon]